MIGASLFIGFAIGCLFASVALCVVFWAGYKVYTSDLFQRTEAATHETNEPENKEVKRLQKQLEEIEMYRGDAR
jgi:hypothetical protein